MEFFSKIPVMNRDALRELKKGIDLSFKNFSREYGDAIEGFFDPLLSFLIFLEKLLVNTPWPIVIGIFGLLAWIGSRNYKLVIGTMVCFLVIGYFGMWKNCMATVAIISVATLVCIVVGIPIGVLMSKSSRAEKAILPVLDMMQTIPSFVYLIPIIMLLGIGKVPGLISCMYLCSTTCCQVDKFRNKRSR
jgi:glycine betaine/proline transport system permease protein